MKRWLVTYADGKTNTTAASNIQLAIKGFWDAASIIKIELIP